MKTARVRAALGADDCLSSLLAHLSRSRNRKVRRWAKRIRGAGAKDRIGKRKGAKASGVA